MNCSNNIFCQNQGDLIEIPKEHFLMLDEKLSKAILNRAELILMVRRLKKDLIEARHWSATKVS